MNYGVTNAIGVLLLDELADILRDSRVKDEVKSLVITSSNDKFFSIGFNLPELLSLNKDAFCEFYLKFNRMCIDLFTFQKPTIAAMNGHAIAGGYILALCCDFRYISEGRNKIGLNDIKLGLPVPYPADCILRALVDSRSARDVTYTGNFYAPEQSIHLGLVNAVLPPEEIQRAAIKKAAALSQMPN